MDSKKSVELPRRRIIKGVGRLALGVAGGLLLAACDNSNKQGPQKPGY